MTRDEFLSLPPGIALAVLYDQMPQRMATVPMPSIPRPPKFDGRLSRKGGYCWMSELDLNSLRFWHGKKSEGAAAGGQYAEKDGKLAKELGYWIGWRMGEPTATWSGERNRQPVRAKPPSRDPEIHQWEPKNGGAPPSSAANADSDDDYFGGGSADQNNSSEYGF